MFDKISICQLNCLLAVAIIVCLFMTRKEGFDTSVAVRTQVGDATNLNTSSGAASGQPIDVYACGAHQAVDASNPWVFDKLNGRSVSVAPDPSGVEFLAAQPGDPTYKQTVQDGVYNAHFAESMGDPTVFRIKPATGQIISVSRMASQRSNEGLASQRSNEGLASQAGYSTNSLQNVLYGSL